MKSLETLKKPLVAAIIGAILGFLVGLLWAWVIQPVKWTNVPPERLGTTYQEEYLRMAIDSFGTNEDADLAIKRYKALGSEAPGILAVIASNPGSQNPGVILRFNKIIAKSGGEVPPPATPVATPVSERGLPLSSMIIVAAVVLIGGVAAAFYFAYMRPMRRRRGEATPAQQAHDLTHQVEKTDFAARGEETPIAQFVTTYVIGDDLYDDSFSIDSPAGEFMGECGIGISESIGVGDPKKVSAFEVWLFDKNDIQTVTKVVMSSHSFNDISTVQRLEAKGEPVLAEPGKKVILETAALQLQAIITDMAYGEGALPAGSHFSRLTMELAIWPKITAPS